MRWMNLIALLAATILGGAGCAQVALRPGPASAASLEAAEAPAANVTSTVSEEPPLPGEPLGAWQGLEQKAQGSESAQAGGHDHAH